MVRVSRLVAFVAGAFQGSGVVHRDFFSMDNYLYGVCDQGSSTLQIIDLTNLPISVSLVYNSDSLISTSHNLFIVWAQLWDKNFGHRMGSIIV